MATIGGGGERSVANLSSINHEIARGAPAGSFDTVTGLSFGAGLSHDTVPGSPVSDSVGGAAHGPVAFAGQGGAATDSVVATQTIQPGGVTLHFADGSSINIVGATHIDGSFFGS